MPPSGSETAPQALSDGAARILAGLLEARTGQQLSMERRWRLDLALQPIMRERGLRSADSLVAALAQGAEPRLVEQIVEALINNETSFFRDQASFSLFATRALDRLERDRASEKRLRIWCAGCSTGQEAYTLAMLFADAPERWADWRIDILATDVSRSAIAQARAGVYSQFEIQRGLPVRLMMRWFEKHGESWRVLPELQRALMFQPHNLVDRAPVGGPYDAVLCRNVLLYFSGAMRKLVFDRLASAIASDGVLMLGAGETVLGNTDRFVSDYEARGLYRPVIAPHAAAADSRRCPA